MAGYALAANIAFAGVISGVEIKLGSNIPENPYPMRLPCSWAIFSMSGLLVPAR